MVCHETYKDQNSKWLSPEEIETNDGKNFYVKGLPEQRVTVGPSESMSKSKKNTIDPQNIINNFGADAVRMFILSDSPPEKDVQWSEQGMISAHKFIQKFWKLHNDIRNYSSDESSTKLDEKLENFTNTMINKITNNLENFHYNVIIASLHEIYNFYSKIIKNKLNEKKLKNNFINILKCFSPIIPHICHECLQELNINNQTDWPKVDKKFLLKNIFKIVVQINGKKRELLEFNNQISKKDLLEEINKNDNILKFIEGKKIKKTIYVENKLINLII